MRDSVVRGIDRVDPFKDFHHGLLVHHSDQGCTYASEDYQDVLDTHGITCSMSRRGNCYDNAVMESFFSTVKSELELDPISWTV